jgi:hypothetical protein
MYVVFGGCLVGRDSSVGIATGYGLDSPGIESRWGRDFPHLPRLALRTTLLYNGYRDFPGGKERLGRDAGFSPPSSAVGHKRLELYLYFPYGSYGLCRASVPVQGGTLPLVDAYWFFVNLLLLCKNWVAEIKEHIIVCYSEVFLLYRLSYLWYTLLGAIVSMTVALIASFFTNPTDPASLDPELLSPVIRRFLPKKEVKKQDVNMALLSGYKVKKDKRHTIFFFLTVQ